MSIREKLLMQKIKKRERIKKQFTQKKNQSFEITPETPPKGMMDYLVSVFFVGIVFY